MVTADLLHTTSTSNTCNRISLALKSSSTKLPKTITAKTQQLPKKVDNNRRSSMDVTSKPTTVSKRSKPLTTTTDVADRALQHKRRMAEKQAQQLLDLNSPSVRCTFEVFGRVQGVHFRRYTVLQARKLHLRGWCENTKAGTVRGELEGPAVQVTVMQNWMRMRGSPKSRVDRVTCSACKPIKAYEFDEFAIRES